MIQFEWNRFKSEINIKKHHISFVEAQTVFDDPLAGIITDTIHSIDEERFIILGVSKKNRLLVVSFVERNDRIRIISARLATKKEKKNYEERFE